MLRKYLLGVSDSEVDSVVVGLVGVEVTVLLAVGSLVEVKVSMSPVTE